MIFGGTGRHRNLSVRARAKSILKAAHRENPSAGGRRALKPAVVICVGV
jgi:hypothetical protein